MPYSTSNVSSVTIPDKKVGSLYDQYDNNELFFTPNNFNYLKSIINNHAEVLSSIVSSYIPSISAANSTIKLNNSDITIQGTGSISVTANEDEHKITIKADKVDAGVSKIKIDKEETSALTNVITFKPGDGITLTPDYSASTLTFTAGSVNSVQYIRVGTDKILKNCGIEFIGQNCCNISADSEPDPKKIYFDVNAVKSITCGSNTFKNCDVTFNAGTGITLTPNTNSISIKNSGVTGIKTSTGTGTAQTGEITLKGKTNVTVSNSGTTFTITGPDLTPYAKKTEVVSGIKASTTGTALTGEITLKGETNVTVTNSGTTFTIAGPDLSPYAKKTEVVTGIKADSDTAQTGEITLKGKTNVTVTNSGTTFTITGPDLTLYAKKAEVVGLLNYDRRNLLFCDKL